MERIRFSSPEDLQRYHVTARSQQHAASDGIICYGSLRGLFLRLFGYAEQLLIGGKKVYVDPSSLKRFQERLAAIEARYDAAALRLQESAMGALRPETVHALMQSGVTEQELKAILNFVSRHIRDHDLEQHALYFSHKQYPSLPRTVLLMPDLSVCILDDLGRYGQGEGATKTLRPAVRIQFALPALGQPITDYSIERVALIKSSELQRYGLADQAALRYARKSNGQLCKQHQMQIYPLHTIHDDLELSPRQRLQLILGAASALAKLHRRGFVHGHITHKNLQFVILPSDDLLCQLGGLKDIRPYSLEHRCEGAACPAHDIMQLASTLEELLPAHGEEELRACLKQMQQQNPAERPSALEVCQRLEALAQGPGSALQERIIAEEMAALPDVHDERHPRQGRLGLHAQSGRLLWERQQLGLQPYEEAKERLREDFDRLRDTLLSEQNPAPEGLAELALGQPGALKALRQAFAALKTASAKSKQALAQLNETMQLAVQRLIDQGQSTLAATTGSASRLQRRGRSYRELRIELRRLDLKRNLRDLEALDPEQISFLQLQDYAKENQSARMLLLEALHTHDADLLQERASAAEHIDQLRKLHEQMQLAAKSRDRAARETLIQPLIAQTRRAYMDAVSETMPSQLPAAIEQLRAMADLPEYDIALRARKQLLRWTEPKSAPDDLPDNLLQWASALRREAKNVIATAEELEKRSGTRDALEALQILCAERAYTPEELKPLLLNLQQTANTQAELVSQLRSSLLTQIETDFDELGDQLKALDWLNAQHVDPRKSELRARQATRLEEALRELETLHLCLFVTRDLSDELAVYSTFLTIVSAPGAIEPGLEYISRARKRFASQFEQLKGVLEDYAKQHRDCLAAAIERYGQSAKLREQLRLLQEKQAALSQERKRCAMLIANAEDAARCNADYERAQALRLMSWQHNAKILRYGVQKGLPTRQLTERDPVDPGLDEALASALAHAQQVTGQMQLRIESLVGTGTLAPLRKEAQRHMRQALHLAHEAAGRISFDLSSVIAKVGSQALPTAALLREAIDRVATLDLPEAMLRELSVELCVAEGFSKFLEQLESRAEQPGISAAG